MTFPPPPSERPLSGVSDLTADDVLEICFEMQRGVPATSALGLRGLQWTHLQERLRTGDPFWAWAVACIEMAKHSLVALAGSVIHSHLTDPEVDAKTRQRAAEMVLTRLSPEFKEKKEIETTVTHQGGVGVDVALTLDRFLRTEKADIRSLTRPPEVIDVDPDAPPALPAPVEARPAPHPDLTRRPVRKD